MNDIIREVHETVVDRRNHPAEKSYTRYLFDEGLDKILKKIGEEASETIIAAKNGNKMELVGEISDLAYHVIVLMVQQGVSLEDIETELANRHVKAGNLKTFKQTDKNS